MRTHWLHSTCYNRRTVFGLALTPLLVSPVRAGDAAAMPPQPDDHLVFLTGPKKEQVVKIDDLAIGGPQVQVYPAAPDGTVRNQSRLNLVILARFDPATLAEETRARSAEGVVAYSGVCTHQGCPDQAEEIVLFAGTRPSPAPGSAGVILTICWQRGGSSG